MEVDYLSFYINKTNVTLKTLKRLIECTLQVILKFANQTHLYCVKCFISYKEVNELFLKDSYFTGKISSNEIDYLKYKAASKLGFKVDKDNHSNHGIEMIKIL